MAALDLVALLCCVTVPGLEVVPDAVRLQQASAAPLDDVVVSSEQGPYVLVVERQVKLTLKIEPSGKAWKGLIGQCLESLERFGPDIDADRRRLGVTAAGPTEDLEDLREVASTAAAQASLNDFLQALQPRGEQYHRVWRHLKTTVANALTKPGELAPAPELVELTAFRIVRRLVVQIEPEGPGHRYVSLCAALEERLIPPGANYDAAELFRIVEDLAAEWGPRGGSVDRTMLRNRLSAMGLVLRGDPPARAALKAVEAWTEDFLSRPRVKDRLGEGLRLERAALRAELADTIAAHRLVLVSGPAGAGKSALARAVAAHMRRAEEVTVAGLSLTEHTWRTVADLDGALGGPGRLATALAGAPTGRRILVVDGAEQALSDDGRLLTGLLALLPRNEEGEALWHVVAVAREQAADAVRDHLAAWGGPVQTMEVGGLTGPEVREVLDAFPALMPLALLPRPARLLSTLYTVDLLVRLLDVGAGPDQFVGEEDVADLVYEHLVRHAGSERPGLGHGDDRSDVYLELAEAAVGGERFARLGSGTGPAKHGLVSDGVLVRERSAFGFAHDVMQDYAVAFLLCEPSAPDVTAAPLPRRLVRAVRIAAQLRLVRAVHRSPAEAAAAWTWITDTVGRLAQQGDARWLDLPFEALFELGRPEPVLAALAEVLLADGGRALVDAARLRLRTVVPALPLLRFLTRHAADLDPVAADGALYLLGRWLPMPDWMDDELAAGVPPAVTTWLRPGSGHAEAAANSLAVTARHLDEAARQVFVQIIETDPSAVQQVLENPVRADVMARHAPDLLAHAARSLYLGQSTARGSISSGVLREGVWDGGWPSVYRPSVIDQLPMPSIPPWVSPTAPDPSYLGPFEALLAHAPDLGVALAGQILDAATEAVTRIETGRGRREFCLVWPLAQGEKVFTGTARSWQWPWAGSLGPGPALAAAARLRRWAHDQAAAGADLGELTERVLGGGRSIALVAVAVGVLALNARRVDDELDAVLAQLDLWALPSSDAVQLDYAIPLIVLRASAERQDGYREMARRLTAEHEQRRLAAGEDDTVRDDVIAKTALLLDSSHYRLVDLPDGAGRALVNDAVVRLGEGRQQAGLLEEIVERFELLSDADRAREEGADAAGAAGLFERRSALERAHRLDPDSSRPAELSVIGPLVASVVARAAAASSAAMEAGQVRWAASTLLTAAAATPSAVTAGREVVKAAVDPRAADRSAATGLPYFLAAPPALLRLAGTSAEAVRAGVLQLAGSAYIEVRSLLCEAITRLWDAGSCAGADDMLHAAGLDALTEMVATAGLTVHEDIAVPREPFRLPDPLDTALISGALFLDLRLVAHATAAVTLASASGCPHSRAARRLAEALATHDLLTWTRQPTAMAGHATGWRHAHDTATAELALDGDRTRLDACLTAFDEDPHTLAGLLRALADQATSMFRVRQLLALWPDMLHRFADRGTAVLRQSLLPRPTSHAPWTPAQARGLLCSWAALHQARPHLADHLLDVLDAHHLFDSPEVALVLDVLGDRAEAVAVSSRRVVPFLARALSEDRAEGDAARARRLLDALAAQRHQEALRVQHQLEESSGLT